MRFAGWITPAWLLVLLLWSAGSQAQPPALSPEEALARFKTAPGFEVRLFASEPEVRQPVTMTFDARGRMWVIQYLQYPTPAGLTPVQVDRYLRTKYDRMPEPPPKGPKGADKITILEDTDGDGRVDRTKDFVTGLNLASALAIGNDGIYVGQAPYLLFYPDRNHDDVPDGDPEVLLTGFGLEDAHAVVNSLQFGPDGWLYGAQGSTVTADIRGVGFQQGIWRYHPATKRFELFSEGGGNTWGLDFDPTGQVLAGTNASNCVGLHQVQGAYHVKGFSKHGPLHNPYSYGYFEHMQHTGNSGGHVTCGGIVYQGDAWPAVYRNTYVGPNLLSNTVYWSSIERRGSTYETRYQGTLLETDDIWFRPIDSLVGPDGNVYVADWYDKRANHVIPEDTWDRTNGRIWKLVYRGTSELPAPELRDVESRKKVDLTKQASGELIKLLAHENVWHRREARRILSERREPEMLPKLRELVDSVDERLALEALWTWYSAGGWSDDAALKLLDHPRPAIREWTVRWIGDASNAPHADLVQRMVELAKSEPAVSVRSQLACTAKRLRGADCLAIVAELLRRSEDANDPHLPLLIWWAVEDKAISDISAVLQLLDDPAAWQLPLVRDTLAERVARRYLAERNAAGYLACERVLRLAPDDATRQRLALALDRDLAGSPLTNASADLTQTVDKIWRASNQDPQLTRFAIRMGDSSAYEHALQRMVDPQQPSAARVPLITAIGQTARPEVVEPLLQLLVAPSDDAIRLAALAALEYFPEPSLGEKVLAGYANYSPAVRARAVAFAVRRPEWARSLIAAVETKQVEPAAVSVDQLRQILALNDASLAPLVEARWGKIRAATPGEKMSYVPVIGRMLGEGPGNFERGHALFTKHCGTCHVLHGEGQKIGPDLTAADRKNRDSLLLNILDPSGTIRPEYVSQTILLVDGRVLTGLVTESNAQQITIADSKGQKSTLARGEIDELKPSEASLMPERLLETLDPQQIRDLFRYLQSDAPPKSAAK